MYRIDDEQRRIRLGRRHLLVPSDRATSVVAVADAVVALHATDAATVFLSACARLTAPDVGAVERALYEDVSLVRLLSMRNTLFTMSRAVAPAVDTSNARRVAAKERQRLLKQLREDGNGLDERWLADVEQQTIAALAPRGRATGSELSAAVPALRTKITVFPGTKQETVQGVASRVIRVLAADGRIEGTCHAAPGPPASSAGRLRNRGPHRILHRPGWKWPGAGSVHTVPRPKGISNGGPAGVSARRATPWRRSPRRKYCSAAGPSAGSSRGISPWSLP